MPRYVLALDLIDNPALIAEYEQYHQEVWPGILANIHDAGITALNIYRTGNRLCMIMETSPEFSFETKAAMDATNPEVQKWETLMWKYQQALPGSAPGEKWKIMKQIFGLPE